MMAVHKYTQTRHCNDHSAFKQVSFFFIHSELLPLPFYPEPMHPRDIPKVAVWTVFVVNCPVIYFACASFLAITSL